MPTVYNSDFDVKSFQNGHCFLESVTWDMYKDCLFTVHTTCTVDQYVSIYHYNVSAVVAVRDSRQLSLN